jgi:GNAT superfamily N-acetyltransferase
MARRIARLTLDTLADLPVEVRESVVWELDPVERARAEAAGVTSAEKEAWLSRVLLEWGSCGRVVYVDDVAAGFVLYAPPVFFPGSVSMPTAPISEDAVQLATAAVFEGYAGGGLGRLLMQEMVKDLMKRGVTRAVEVFGRAPQAEDDAVLPVEFLQRVGFKTQRAHARYPRMRMETRSVLTWRADLELALERLLGVVRPGRTAPAAPAGRLGRLRPPGR